MRILVVSQYFWPENFRINDLSASLREKGHEVTVLTGEPNYPDGDKFDFYLENPDLYSYFHGCNIVRVPIIPRGKGKLGLILNYLSYFISASTIGLWKLHKESFDVVFVCQLSPVTVALPAILYKKIYKKPIVMWVLDLWPESLSSVGFVNSKKILNITGRLVSYIYNQCDQILAQSKSFMAAIKSSSKPDSNILYFPSWAESVFDSEKHSVNEEKFDKQSFNILFAGNIGEAQDFPSIINAMELLKNKNINVTLNIVGDGRKLSWVKEEVYRRHLGNFIKLFGRFPLESMPSFYRQADAFLVALKDTPIFSMTIPGKVQSYMASGKPVLTMLGGETANVIKEANCGLAAPSGDFHALAKNIETMFMMPEEERIALGINGKNYSEKAFNRDIQISFLEKILSNVKILNQTKSRL